MCSKFILDRRGVQAISFLPYLYAVYFENRSFYVHCHCIRIDIWLTVNLIPASRPGGRGMKKQSEPNNKSTLMAKARSRIREAIIHGRLKPGEHLKESKLAEELQISRFPIREALRYLQKEGLVETIPYKGTFVKRLSQKDAIELFTLRNVIEALAVRLMISRLTEEMITELKQAIIDMEQAEKEGDLLTSAEEDLRFHRLICQYSDNSRLLAVWDDLALHLKLFLLMGKSGYGIDTEYVRTHLSLLQAIEQRDAELAEAHVKIHIADGIQYLLQNACCDLEPV